MPDRLPEAAKHSPEKHLKAVNMDLGPQHLWSGVGARNLDPFSVLPPFRVV